MNKAKIKILLLLGIILLGLMLISSFFYEWMYYGDYKTPRQQVYTCYDYFYDLQEGNVLSEANYEMLMKSAFLEMIDDREVVVDKEIPDEILEAYVINPISFKKENIGCLKNNIVEYELKGQRYSLLSENEAECKIILCTGTEWESASVIQIFPDSMGNIIVAPKNLFGEVQFEKRNLEWNIVQYEEVKIEENEDATIQRISGIDHKKEIILKHILFIIFLMSTGTIILQVFWGRTGAISVWFTLPLGIVNGILSMLLLIASHLKITLASYLVFNYLMAILIRILLKKYSIPKDRNLIVDRNFLINVLLCGGVILWFCFFPNIILSYDSVYNIYIGKYAGVLGELNSILGRVTAYSLFIPLIEVGSTLFGLDLNYSLQPILTITSLVVICWGAYKTISFNKLSNKLKVAILLYNIAALMFNPMFYIQIFWKLNNLPIGLFGGIAVALHIFYYQTEDELFWNIANLFLSIVAIARVESGIFVALYFICFHKLLQKEKMKRNVERISLQITVLQSIMYIYYYLIIGNVDSAFWTPGKGALVVFVLWLVYGYLKVADIVKEKLERLYSNIDIIMIVCIAIVIAVFGVFDTEKIISNLLIYIYNMGNYGGYWGLAFIVVLMTIIKWNKEPILRFLSTYILSYVLMIPALMIFRENPIRIGFGDSACRMLSHVIFAVVILGIYVICNLLEKDKLIMNKREEKGMFGN